jgi:hypothetical protein
MDRLGEAERIVRTHLDAVISTAAKLTTAGYPKPTKISTPGRMAVNVTTSNPKRATKAYRPASYKQGQHQC